MATPTVSPETWEMLQEKPQAFAGIVEGLVTSLQQQAVTSSQNQGRLYKSAVDATAKWRAAQQSGSDAAIMEAVTDLAKLKADLIKDANRVDRNLINNIKLDVATGLGRDWRAGDVEFAKRVWQEYAKRTGSPETVPTLLGDLESLGTEFPFDASFITGADDLVQRNWKRIQATREISQNTVDLARGVVDEAEGLKQRVAETGESPQTILTRAASEFQHLRGNESALQALEDQTKKAFDVQGDLRPEWEKANYKDTQDLLNTMLAGPGGEESDKARHDLAWFISSPKVQAWGGEHGFQLGRIVEPEPGKVYPPGVVIPGVGIYIPGPDDQKAANFADREIRFQQAQGGAMNRLVGPKPDQQPTFVEVTLKRGVKELPEYRAEDGTYYTRQVDGKTEYLRPDEVKKSIEEVRAAKKGAETLTDEQALQVLGYQKANEPATEAKTEVIRGRRYPGRLADPKGTFYVIHGDTGEERITPDMVVSQKNINEPADRQTPRRFMQALEGRVATRKANTMAEEKEAGGSVSVRRPAENAARALVPEPPASGYADTRDKAPPGTPTEPVKDGDFEARGFVKKGVSGIPRADDPLAPRNIRATEPNTPAAPKEAPPFKKDDLFKPNVEGVREGGINAAFEEERNAPVPGAEPVSAKARYLQEVARRRALEEAVGQPYTVNTTMVPTNRMAQVSRQLRTS